MSRALAVLRAIADGRAQATCSCEPDLCIDGVACCDQMLAHRLGRDGYYRVPRAASRPRLSWGRPVLTAAGWRALVAGSFDPR